MKENFVPASELEKRNKEIESLKKKLDKYEASAKRSKKIKWGLSKFLAKLFFGGSVTRNFNKASDAWLKWSQTKKKNDFARAYGPSRNLLGAIVSRFTRVSILGLLIALITPVLLLWQTILFQTQNKEFQKQNKAILNQFEQNERFERRRELNQELQAIVAELYDLTLKFDEMGILKPSELPVMLERRIETLARNAIWWDQKELKDRKSNIRGALVSSMVSLNLSIEKFSSRFSNLEGAELDKCNLVNADLFGSDLKLANLTEANLTKTDLKRARLDWANLSGANLTEAELVGASLIGTKLSEVKLTRADLVEASLAGAILTKADLTGANLTGADLSGAHFEGASLEEANLSGAYLGGIRGWKNLKSIKHANIYGIEYPSKGFREWALANNAVEMEFTQYQEYLESLD